MGKRWRFLFVGNFFHLSFWLGHFTLDIFFLYTLRAWVLVCKSVFFFVLRLLGTWFHSFSLLFHLLWTWDGLEFQLGGVDIFSFSVYSVRRFGWSIIDDLVSHEKSLDSALWGERWSLVWCIGCRSASALSHTEAERMEWYRLTRQTGWPLPLFILGRRCNEADYRESASTGLANTPPFLSRSSPRWASRAQEN